jgi:hypothetical protein
MSSFLNDQKLALFTNLEPKTFDFKKSFKMTYFNAVFRPKITQKKFTLFFLVRVPPFGQKWT